MHSDVPKKRASIRFLATSRIAFDIRAINYVYGQRGSRAASGAAEVTRRLA
jgi:hypothetical protein